MYTGPLIWMKNKINNEISGGTCGHVRGTCVARAGTCVARAGTCKLHMNAIRFYIKFSDPRHRILVSSRSSSFLLTIFEGKQKLYQPHDASNCHSKSHILQEKHENMMLQGSQIGSIWMLCTTRE